MFKTQCKIVLADDHPIMLHGLQQGLIKLGYSNIVSCNNGKDALKLIQLQKPNLAILDIEMPFLTAFEIINTCHKEQIEVSFLLVSYHKDKSYILAAKKYGVQGFMLKEDSIQEIDDCIQAVMNQKPYYSKSLGIPFLENIDFTLDNLDTLTYSEIRILKLVASGMNSSQISTFFAISKRTVEKHRANIIAKIQHRSSSFSLQQWAIENKRVIESL